MEGDGYKEVEIEGYRERDRDLGSYIIQPSRLVGD